MSNDLAIFEKSLALGSLSSYIHWTNQLPMLTEEEKNSLLSSNTKTIWAARKLPCLIFVCCQDYRGYDGYGPQQADLTQEGNIGPRKP